MNVPAVAKNTFDLLMNQPEFLKITQGVMRHLKKIKSELERARFVHHMVDAYNQETFSHPLLKKLVPCKLGCSACCHTQVSVTEDEAHLLYHNIANGVEINYDLLFLQADAGNDADKFYQLSYEKRKCVFLDDGGKCKVYKDRPSVCRTNAVLGEASQCSTKDVLPQALRLVKTPKSDMVIVASYADAKESGALPVMLAKIFREKNAKEESLIKSILAKIVRRKPFPKDLQL